MLENTSSATRLAREKMSINLFSLLTSIVMQMPVTMTMVGTMPRVMRVSFHWTTKATTKAATNVEQLWTKTVRRSRDAIGDEVAVGSDLDRRRAGLFRVEEGHVLAQETLQEVHAQGFGGSDGANGNQNGVGVDEKEPGDE